MAGSENLYDRLTTIDAGKASVAGDGFEARVIQKNNELFGISIYIYCCNGRRLTESIRLDRGVVCPRRLNINDMHRHATWHYKTKYPGNRTLAKGQQDLTQRPDT
jgi:hypothetical protein